MWSISPDRRAVRGDVVVLVQVVRADQQHDGARIALPEPGVDVRVELVDPPADVTLVVVVAEFGRTVGHGSRIDSTGRGQESNRFDASSPG